MSDNFSLFSIFTDEKIATIAKWLMEHIPTEATISVGVGDCAVGMVDPDDVKIVTVSPTETALNPDICQELQDRIGAAAETYECGEPIDYDTDELPVLTFSIENRTNYLGLVLVSVKPSDDKFVVGDCDSTDLIDGLERLIIDMLPFNEGDIEEESEDDENRIAIGAIYGNFGCSGCDFDIAYAEDDDDEPYSIE